jgi:hypothetical protein
MLRATALSHLAEVYTSRTGDIIDTLCRENGMLRPVAGYEARFIPHALRFAAGLAVYPSGRAAGTQRARERKVRPDDWLQQIALDAGLSGMESLLLSITKRRPKT